MKVRLCFWEWIHMKRAHNAVRLLCLSLTLHSSSEFVAQSVVNLLGCDPLERPHVLHLFAPRVQVAPRFRGRTRVASARFRPRISSCHFFLSGIRMVRWSP